MTAVFALQIKRTEIWGRGFTVYEGFGWGGIIPYSVKYKSRVGLYNIFPSHKADDVFYYQQSSVHV